MNSAGRQIFEFGEFRLDTTRRLLTDIAGHRVELTAKAFDALVYFLEHPGVVIDRLTLLDTLWPDTVVEENNLNQTVAALRRALGDDYIETVPRRGYQFVAEVCHASDMPGIRPARSSSMLSRRPLVTILASIIVVAVGYAVLRDFTVAPDSRQPLPKIAVLPCDNLSPDPDDAYLALSLHQEILDQLGKLSGLLVISRSSVMQYAEERPSIPKIAEIFDATAVMECSVRYSGGRIVVTAQLIDPESDSQLWSQTYPGDLANVSAVIEIQADIAMRVADAMGAEYLPEERRRLEDPPTASLDAYAEYLRAKQAVTWGGYSLGYSSDDFQAHINKAIEADAEFAQAYSDRAVGHLSRALDELVVTAMAASPDSSDDTATVELALARQDASRALAFDPRLGRSHAVLGAVEYVSGNTEVAQTQFKRAVEFSPNDAEMLSIIVGFYLRDGRQKEALDLLAHIKRLNPVDRDVGFYFYLAGDRNTAMQLLRRMSKLNPADEEVHGLIGYCLAIDGNSSEAETELRLAEELLRRDVQTSQVNPTPGTLSTLAYSYSRIGLTDDAQRIADWFVQISDPVPVNPMRWAEINLALGDIDKAYEMATIAAERPLLPFVSLELDFVLNAYNDPVFEQPRFVALRRKLGGKAFPEAPTK